MPETGIVAGVRRAATTAAGALSRGDGGSGDAVRQTLTIGGPAAEVAAAWRDATTLSRALGDLGSVEAAGDGRYRWQLGDASWSTRLVEQDDVLRHVEADGPDDGGRSLTLTLRAAPSDLGTEATLTMDAPLPALAAGGAAFTVLYRLRALLITGEAPTISPQPSGRRGDR